MLALLPYAFLDPSLVELGPFCSDNKARLTYPPFEDVPILTPPLRLVGYDPDTSRITFDTSEHRGFSAKLAALQDRIETLVPKKDIPLLYLYHREKQTLTLFTPPSTTVQTLDGTLVPLKEAHLVRCAVRLFHVCHHASNTYRIQHHVLKLWSIG